ncbi:hypothetical protein ACIRSU_04200 [Streptomyces sp. NPDC101160]|uniref:hypothetical protein n=1 Tax=Streptomyces sp. NPDC101160 TaxID=3366118 RepID=UPI003809910A
MGDADHAHEPVFKKSKWGTNRYTYNPDNPIGLALIIGTVLFAVLVLGTMEHRGTPSEPGPTPSAPTSTSTFTPAP